MQSLIPDISKSLLLSEYAGAVAPTDIIDPADFKPILQGLFGEVGGIMSTAKKHVREGNAYPRAKLSAVEEFGDTLWYLAALSRRMDLRLDDLFVRAAEQGGYQHLIAASDLSGAIAQIAVPRKDISLDSALFDLGRGAAALLGDRPEVKAVEAFAFYYLNALHVSGLSFAEVAHTNVSKVRGAFLDPAPASLVDFDAGLGSEEQLPRFFKIRINQRPSGKSYLRWRGVFVGDPLTDNIGDRDGYRFHDVFHFAYAAILHWSPVMRALIKHKRKSQPRLDEEEDSGRAIVVEEGLTAWLFSRAKELDYFEGQTRVSLGILKTVREFVDGYEVEKCPLRLWERAILDGYRVFRQIRDGEGGWVVGSRVRRTIEYRPLEAKL
ncbi:nucleoside triphosphate pyrophosphohydrolase family protein [Nevskia soli]|uniref:nucleoside triphosphate pyrophosphohydrolase family protein n=1 Tax=Nevskia soli TaxID=418856 RepID=UPI001FE01244|nr:nucleoside triphosphate pyrophosphohydrolase family protein [Nevskia soli]